MIRCEKKNIIFILLLVKGGLDIWLSLIKMGILFFWVIGGFFMFRWM
jgi:hypothetical protein